MKRWVDPPNGWKYGFPKVYDETKDGPDVRAWLIKQGYPEDADIAHLRTWPAEEGLEEQDEDSERRTSFR